MTTSADPTSADPARNRRHLIAALTIAGLLVAVRSLLITAAHSECFDARAHVDRGLAFLGGDIVRRGLMLNDPAFGDGLLALPVAALNRLWGRAPSTPWDEFFYRRPPGPEWTALAVALWKSLLFVPFLAVVFVWCRRLYGLEAAWLALALVVVDPTIGAHVPVMALDVLGLEGIVLACFALWTFARQPTRGRAVAAGLATGLALSLKHTALVVPLIGALFVFVCLVRVRRSPEETGAPSPRVLWRALPLVVASTLFSVWACTLFDVQTPPLFDPPAASAAAATVTAPPVPAHLGGMDQAERTWVKSVLRLRSPWPGGLYVHSLLQGLGHGALGHPAYLLGEFSARGWWYYHAIVASYKVPLGILTVFALALWSVRWVPFRFEELSLLIPAVGYAAFVARSGICIGFRHALPAYVFFLMLAARCVAARVTRVRAVAWAGVLAAGLHAASVHPDYLGYFNFPRDRPYLAISDSNVDWGQSLKQVKLWAEAHPDRAPVTLAYFGQGGEDMFAHYLGDRVRVFGPDTPLPRQGTLIVSPVLVLGVYDSGKGPFTRLRDVRPHAVIGHAMLVYDMERLLRESDPAPW